MIGFIAPVFNRFDLFAQMMVTVDMEVRPYVMDNFVHNRGVSGGWNEGMRRALSDGCRYAFITNDDVWFSPGALKCMYDTIVETQAVLVSANQNGVFDTERELFEGADFFCFIVDIPQLISHCGTFDENFFPAYFEDNDMHYRIRLAGRTSYIQPKAVVMHHGSATQNADPNNPVTPPHQFENNRRYFAEKWGGIPGAEEFTNPFRDVNKQVWDWEKR